MKELNSTERTKINRQPKRASYNPDTIYKILDETFICQVGFKIENQVYIIPTLYGRKDDSIFIHGSVNSRMLKSFEKGEDICVSVTLVDGIVLARSAFHHSINYRSVIIFGKPVPVTSKQSKVEALKTIMEHMVPGRWEEVRKPNDKELSLTSVYSLKINEASAKIRTGSAVDDREDLSLNVWAGVLPLKMTAEKPIDNPDLKENILLPNYLKNFGRKK